MLTRTMAQAETAPREGADPVAPQPAPTLAALTRRLHQCCCDFQEAVNSGDRAAVARDAVLSSESGQQLKFHSSRALKRVLECSSDARKEMERAGASTPHP